MNFFSRLYQKILSPYHYFWAFVSALFLGFPGKKLKVIGVTGTKGKSTVVELTNKILEEAGFKTAFLSSISIKIGENLKTNYFKMTMPGRWHVQKFLKNAKKAKCEYVVLEITSEGILQHRQKFIDFEAVVFTGISPEHIERHGSFEKYKAAKMKLFKENQKIHILNLDDKKIEEFLKPRAESKYGFSLRNNLPEMKNIKIIHASDIGEEIDEIEFKVKDIEFELDLLGKFNIQNALAAISVALSQGISLEVCKKALKKVKGIPGRMETVIKNPFKVIVDYAHTPDSLGAVYKANSKFKKENSKMVCVLGAAGGGRDTWKRPKLGKIAGKYCDEIIVTNEDPYNEEPMKIIKEVSGGVEGKKVNKILDRREGIKKALKLAKEKDIVIITGKGCEPWMCVAGGKKIPWDDRKIAKEEFKKIKKSI